MSHYRCYLACVGLSVGLLTGSLAFAVENVDVPPAEQIAAPVLPSISAVAESAPEAIPDSVPAATSSRVNINTATIAELMKIKGIGLAKAKAIFDYREAHGPFASADDVATVPGIGPHRLQKIAQQITVK